jgi:dephospho-CoA kinase
MPATPDTPSPNAPSGASEPARRRRFVVGLTGGIGSGKSTVADRFAALGATIVDTDAIAHELTGPGGAAMARIRAEFGDGVIAPDGRLDRAAMREIAFKDPQARKRLEAILHPMIRQTSEQRIAQATGPYAISVVPLLVEGGNWKGRVDRVLVVDCPEEVQVARVMQRSGLAAEQVRAIMAAQATRAARLAAADDVVDNGGAPGAFDAQVVRLHERYVELARAVAGAGPAR